MRFIGHLDFMRFFQKVIRRAGIDIRFSEGISPHMVMSFASPLGVGVTSEGEYVDIELNTPVTTQEGLCRLNACSVDGVRFLDFREIPEGKGQKAMSLVAAADYEVGYLPGHEPCGSWTEQFMRFLEQDRIIVTREKKKAQKKAGGRKASDIDITQTLDIRPLIFHAEAMQRDPEIDPFQAGCTGPFIRVRLSSGSAANLRPDLVMKTFTEWIGAADHSSAFRIHRLDLLCRKESASGSDSRLPAENHDFISLGDLGEQITSL
ncbi:MAG: DUF2344 domain-containing protein [Lachnospiraceae bacterium]|nr:DUF2344 domain-containing protein [Lachnospiraceae bacterium]